MAKYRKKPVEATQWFKNEDHLGDRDYKGNVPYREEEGAVVRYYRKPSIDGEVDCHSCQQPMHNHGWIDTAQGGYVVCPGDWIITDDRVKKDAPGRFYPCKPDIFEATYEIVDNQP